MDMHPQELHKIFHGSRMLTKKSFAAFEKVLKQCFICGFTDPPKERLKISVAHVHYAFTEEVMGDFTKAYIDVHKCELLNLINRGIGYGKICITNSRNSKFMMQLYHKSFLCLYGAPSTFSADPESCRVFYHKFRKSRRTVLYTCPSRHSHNNSPLERILDVFKSIL